MNVYNEAHNLKDAIKNSEEYKQYEAVKEKVKDLPELQKNLDDFKQKQIAFQAAQMMGEMDQEVMTQIQGLYAILASDPLAAEYLQCEMRFSLMINDVYQILGEAIDMGLKIPGTEE